MLRSGLFCLAGGLLAAGAAVLLQGCSQEAGFEGEHAAEAQSSPEAQQPPIEMLVQQEWRDFRDAKSGRDGVAGYGYGRTEDGSLSVLIFVESEEALSRAERLAGSIASFTHKGESLPTQTILTGRFRDRCEIRTAEPHKGMADPRDRARRPVPIGVSASHPRVSAGTLGCRLRSRADPEKRYALGCSHSFAALNYGIRGQDAILHPSYDDGGRLPDDRIGTLASYVELDLRGRSYQLADAAIAEVTSGDVGKSTPPDGYGSPKTEALEAESGLPVMKYGRTAPFWAEGVVRATRAEVDVYFGQRSRRAVFADQIVVGPTGFAAGGDSGALLVAAGEENACRPVGLLFALSCGKERLALANPIATVLGHEAFKDLGLEIDGGGECRLPTSIEEVLATNSYRFRGIEGVTGFGQGRCDGENCLMVYVEALTPAIREALPTSIRGIPVQIEETGIFEAMGDEKEER